MRTTFCPRCLAPSTQNGEAVLFYCDLHLPEVEAEVRALYPPKRTATETLREGMTSLLLCALVFLVSACAVRPTPPPHWVQCPGEPVPHLISEERLKDYKSCQFV